MQIITPDLKAIAAGQQAQPQPHLGLEWIANVQGKPALKVKPLKQEYNVEDEWLLVISGIEFRNGVIEFDALGQSEPPQINFLGVAFRVVDDRTHDALYFRPFNFRAEDPVRKIHAVQYISHPEHHWFGLRDNHPGEYEQPITPAPDGDTWFHARIVVERPRVSVYVNHGQKPSPVVDELSDRESGGIGLWVGPGQGGYFSDLKIISNE